MRPFHLRPQVSACETEIAPPPSTEEDGMGEIDELRAKAIASMPSSANPSSSSLKAKSPETREEGELSSGGDDPELPTCSTSPSNSTALDERIPTNALTNNLTQSTKAANKFSASGSSMAAMRLRTPVTRTYNKQFKTKHVPFKSRNSRSLCWHGKGSNDNLVISFSDDDSGSDSGEPKLEKDGNRKDNIVAKSKIAMTSARAQPKVVRGLPTNRTKLMLNKGSVSCAPISSIVEVRGTSYGHSVASTVGKDPQSRRHNPVVKSSTSQEHELVQDAHLADDRLESLRHQIAARENELKVHSKSLSQTNERTVVSHSDQHGPHVMKLDTQVAGICRPTPDPTVGSHVMKLDAQKAGIRRPASDPTVGSSANKQALKRSKLDECFKSKTCSAGKFQMQVPSTRFISELNKDRNAMDCLEGEKINFIGRADPRPVMRYQEANRDDAVSSKSLLSGMKDHESLRLTTSATMHNLEVPSKLGSTFTADVSCCFRESGTRAIAVDPCNIQNESLCLTRAEPSVDDGALGPCDTPIHKMPISESPRFSSISRGADVPNLLRNKSNKADLRVSMESSKHNFESSDHGTDHQLCNDETNISGMGRMHLESLAKLEELQDKQLEEAQELRRTCELEERLAMKAYRKAQRALVDANERCTRLYRKRELFSAQLRTLIMEASSSMWPSSWQNHKGTVSDSVKNVPSASFDLLASLGHQLTAGPILDRLGYEYNDQCPDGAYQQISGNDFRSEQFSEPDGSTSEPRDNNAMNDICAAANPPNMSTEEEDVNFPFDSRSVELRLSSDANGGNHGGKTLHVNIEGERLLSGEIAQDYELLEATLRSKLVARLGMRPSSKVNAVSNADCTVDDGVDSPGLHKKPSAALQQGLQEGGKKQASDLEGIERPVRSNGHLTAEFHYQSNGNSSSIGDESNRNADPEENSSFPKKFCWPLDTAVSSLPSSVLHIVSSRAKFILSGCCSRVPTTEEKGHMWKISAIDVSEHLPDVGESSNGYSLKSTITGGMDPRISDAGIDPFRPFCMFELRGKCNDKECPWQHVKNCPKGNLKHNEHAAASSADGCISRGKSNGPFASSHGPCHHILPVPTYQIGSNLINVESHLSQSVLARSNWLYWQRGFCASFPLPFSLQRNLSPDAPFLQSGDGPVADDYTRKGLSFYFQRQDGAVVWNQFMQDLPDSEHSLEMVLDLFDGKVYTPDRKKGLSLLSRAIEADPNSVVHWVVYLHILYRKEEGVGKDDMFFHAVQHNGGSYELWLLYINSRMQLDDRLNAYDNALTLFCQRKDTCEEDSKHTSACILDISLQMIDFLCMSGNVDKALSRINGLLPKTHIENSSDTLLSDVHSCLVVSDKCIFWFCCIYFVIYEKLPEPIVQQFEFEKDLPFGIAWPSAQLTIDRKGQALQLIKVALDDLALDIDVDSHRRDQTALRSLHFLAISHISCLAVLEGLRSSIDLLVKYMNLYPTCIELVLMAARLHDCRGDDILKGFEDALCNWPKESPGLQCLWNQYAEHSLGNRGFDFVEKLMTRWFHGFWKGKYPCSENLDSGEDGSNSSSKLQSDGGLQSFLEDDDTFGFLNLFLYRILQKNLGDAQLAIDKALELATPKNYKHCVREHAAFIFSNESASESISGGLIYNLLKGYLRDSRISPVLEPLSRRYFQTIKKLRIRQLISNILGPVSMDFSLLNSILEVCYGSSLLPETFGEPKDLVDFVESLMEITPANYVFGLSVFRFTSRNFSHTGVNSNAIQFWASSILVNSILQAVPVAPEHVWLEASDVLRNLENFGLSLKFHQQAISVYPFSIKLWQSYLDLSRIFGNTKAVVEGARERGIELNQTLV